MAEIDWRGIFVPMDNPLEVVVRGTLMYFLLLALMRITVKRNLGQMGPSDLLMVTLIADAAQNGMAGNYQSVPEGVLLCATIIGWSQLVEFLASRSRIIGLLTEPRAIPLVIDGRVLVQNLRREFLTEDELMSQLRIAGVESLDQVKRAVMEPEGKISVLRADGKA